MSGSEASDSFPKPKEVDSLARIFVRRRQRERLRTAWRSGCVGALGGVAAAWILVGWSLLMGTAPASWVLVLILPGFCLGGCWGWLRSKRSNREWARLFDLREGWRGGDHWSAWVESSDWSQPWREATRSSLAQQLSSIAVPARYRVRAWSGELGLVGALLGLFFLWHIAGERALQHEQRIFAVEQEVKEFWQAMEAVGVEDAVLEQWQRDWEIQSQAEGARDLEERWQWFADLRRDEGKSLSAANQGRLDQFSTESSAGERRDSQSLATAWRQTSEAGERLAERVPERGSDDQAWASPQVDPPPSGNAAAVGRVAEASSSAQAPTNQQEEPSGANSPALGQTAPAQTGAGTEAEQPGSTSPAPAPLETSNEARHGLAQAPEEGITSRSEGPSMSASGGERAANSALSVEASSELGNLFPINAEVRGEEMRLDAPDLGGVGEIFSVLAAAERWEERSSAGEALRLLAVERGEEAETGRIPPAHRDKVRAYFSLLRDGAGPSP
jgi:hypothetical protein